MRKRWQKIGAMALIGILGTGLLADVPTAAVVKAAEGEPAITAIPDTDRTMKDSIDTSFLSVTGFAKGKVRDRTQYINNEDAYQVVTNEEEFLEALQGARGGNVKVIEIQSDLYLGWNELSAQAKSYSMINQYESTNDLKGVPISNPSMIESGVSTLTLDGITGLTIFSENGNTINHVEIKLNSKVDDLIIRNLKFTDTWDWDDKRSSGYGSTGQLGTAKRTGYTYLKINGANNIWIDHCDFGVSYDGCVDIENGSHGVSLTWCNIGDTDYSVGSMLYKSIAYLETLYQQNKTNKDIGTFIIYSVMRDNNMSLEDIAKYMGYHKKCHLGGGGESDSWWFDEMSETLLDAPDPSRSNANEYLRMTFAYNNWTNIGSRVPLLRGGVGHLFNCYTDDSAMNQAYNVMSELKDENGKNIREQVSAKNGSLHFMSRGMNALLGASIAADTNVYYYVDEPMIGAEKDGGSYADLFGYNHSLIVNSKLTKTNGKTYTGSSWDNNGENLFTETNMYSWTDKSTIGNWSWGWEGETLSYSYQTFPLEDVEENVKTYGGAYTMNLSKEWWLKTEYRAEDADITDLLVDKTVDVPIETISLSKENAILYMQEEFLQLDARVTPSHTTEKAETFTWTSSNETVATVNDCGLVIPKKSGTATITVRTEKGLTASCEVRVVKLPEKVTIQVPGEVTVGTTFQAVAIIEPEDTVDKNVIWKSAGTAFEVVDAEQGIFRAVKTGTGNAFRVQATTTVKGNRVGNNNGVEGRSDKIKVVEAVAEVVDKGNVDDEDGVGLNDALLVLRFALNIEKPKDDVQFKNADVDENGEIEMEDALQVLKYALSIIREFEVAK